MKRQACKCTIYDPILLTAQIQMINAGHQTINCECCNLHAQ